MKFLILILLIVGINVGAQEVCGFKWMHSSERTDNSHITKEEMKFEIEAYGVSILTVKGRNRSFYWLQDKPCASCTDLRIRAIDINNPNLKSEWATGSCPPDLPLVCY